MEDLSPTERLIALAGSERVSGYSRRTKSGKTVHVSSYTRDPGKMTNNALYAEYQNLLKGKSDLPEQAASNRKAQITKEIAKRTAEGRWGASDKRTAERAKAKVASPKPEENKKPRGTGHSTAMEHVKNTVSPKPELDDKSYEEHVSKIKAILENPENDKFDTQRMFGIEDPSNPGKMLPGVYQPERAEQHRQIVSEILEKHANVPKERKALMSGGLGGSGKGTVLGKFADVDHSQWITVDPDEMKQELLKRGMVPEIPGLLPLEHANYIHEESSDLANMLHFAAMQQGYNVILDTTMASMSAKKKIDSFKDAGYDVEAIFVDVPVEVSVTSALGRHKGGVDRFLTGKGDLGGRYVPPEVIQKAAPSPDSPYNSKNREIFEELRKEGLFTRARIFDNSDRSEGSTPKMVFDSSGGAAETGQKGVATKKALGNIKDQQKGRTPAKVGLSSPAVEKLLKLTRVN